MRSGANTPPPTCGEDHGPKPLHSGQPTKRVGTGACASKPLRPTTSYDSRSRGDGGPSVSSCSACAARETRLAAGDPFFFPDQHPRNHVLDAASRPRPRPYRQATPRGRGKERRAAGPTHPCPDTSISVTPTALFHACFIMYCTSYYLVCLFFYPYFFLPGNQLNP